MFEVVNKSVRFITCIKLLLIDQLLHNPLFYLIGSLDFRYRGTISMIK